MKSKKKAMPVGVEDFGKIITGNYFWIDKTRFIRELLDAHGDVTLITRPRRFGKTLTLSMLQYFFTMEHAEENRKLFAGLDIEQAGEAYMKEQGTRPVVSLTLKGVQTREFLGMMESFSELLRKLYGRFSYLGSSAALSVQEQKYFSSILDEISTVEKMKSAVSNLLEFLEKHYGKKAILLLDEYDAPSLSAWEHGYYDECMDFMRGFLGNALKTNPSLDFAVLTGVTRISKESIFSGLNNLKVCSVLSDQYSDILGFTQEEAAGLME
ncbi:MAG: AAA family ATPase, partial [Selenomonadaceae bacterium]|nr:AAA family ATPase [Selenomonadaceae bacterium]